MGKVESVVSNMARMLSERVWFFRDQDKRRYARLRAGRRWTYPLKSEEFRHWAMHTYCKETGRDLPKPEYVKQVIDRLDSEAFMAARTMESHTRVAEVGGRILVDLTDEEWRAVSVGPDGWHVEADPPVLFRRYGSQMPLPVPERAADGWERLRALLPSAVEEDDFILLVAWLLGTLLARVTCPVLVLNGPQRSGKSITSRMLKLLVDPGRGGFIGDEIPEHDLNIAAESNLLLCVNNVSYLTTRKQDEFCRLATEGGSMRRKLYSDRETSNVGYRRPLIINGIPTAITRPDLLDRCILITFPKMAGQRTERELWQAFERDHAVVLGAFLDAVSEGLRRWDSTPVPPGDTVRQLEWAQFVIAAEAALPWTPGRFLALYEANQRNAREIMAEGSQLLNAMELVVSPRLPTRQFTAMELLDKLRGACGAESIWRNPKLFPQTPQQLMNELKRLSHLLEDRGFEVLTVRSSGRRMVQVSRDYGSGA